MKNEMLINRVLVSLKQEDFSGTSGIVGFDSYEGYIQTNE